MVRPMTPQDAQYVCNHLRDIDYAEVMGLRWSEDLNTFAQEVISTGGPAFTICTNDGTPAVIGGVTLISPNVGNAWCIGTDHWNKVRIKTTRVARKLLTTMISHDCHRIQALSADFHIISHDWLLAVGFKHEATLERVGKHANDYLLFSMVSDHVL